MIPITSLIWEDHSDLSERKNGEVEEEGRMEGGRTDRVSYLQAGAGTQSWDDLPVETGGVKGQRELFWNALQLQFHSRTDFLYP